MRTARPRKPRPPLTPEKLDELALFYVGRFATTRAKLRAYLTRKLRERGWESPRPPDVDAIAERFAAQGYVDDCAFALAKSQALTGRGYGVRRVDHALRLAGVEEADGQAARALADAGAAEAALRFARRRRLGPYGDGGKDPKARQRALAAMVRAGHDFGLARAILDLEPGSETDVEALAEAAGRRDE